MKRSTRMVASCIAFAATSLFCSFQQAAAKDDPPAPANTEVRRLDTSTKPWKGDFDGMLERRLIRFYVPYSRSLYFLDKGQERGVSATLIREFERWVNRKYPSSSTSAHCPSSSSSRRATSCATICSKGRPTSRSATSRFSMNSRRTSISWRLTRRP